MADGAPDGGSSNWVLTLTPTGRQSFVAVLGDGQWLSFVAESPWPPACGLPALPSAILRELPRVTAKPLRLQLPAALDDFAWEAELAAAAAGLGVVPRYVTDLADPAQDAALSLPLVGPAVSGPQRLELARAARWRRRPLVLAEPGLRPEQCRSLERRLRSLWRDPLLLSQALGEALEQTGLPLACCRLYGDGPALLGDVEQGLRPVTALSIDLVNSTSLLRTVGAEAYAQRLQDYHELCRDVIMRFEGSLDVPQGDDGLMAYFGFPVAVEDAAARALHAAWQLARGVAGQGMQVRIGVASGQVAVSAQQAFGSEVHLAARLRAVAEPGQILVAPSTHERAGQGFRLEACLDGLTLKDFGRLQTVYRLDGPSPAPHGAGSRGGRAGPFVGRQHELEQLRSAWNRVRGGRLQWYVVQGEAGIGKSSLLHRFARELHQQGCPCLELVGQAQGGHSPFAAIADALCRFWALRVDGDAVELSARLAALLPQHRRSREDVAALARLLAPAQVDPEVDNTSGDRRWGELLVELLQALVEQGPLCLLVDDAHWLDPSTVDVLRRLRDACAGRPLLVLAGERIEAGRTLALAGAVRLELQGLSEQESHELVGHLGEAVPERLRQRVVERAEGVPLYLEESLRMLDHAEGATGSDVPATLEDLLMVRLDSLGPDRAMAQLVSLLGRDCSRPQLDALLACDDPFIERARRQGSLASLLNSGLVLAQGGASPGYRFKHALIRDAAYGSIWLDDRRRLHRLCAELIERHASDLWPRRPEQLAYHLEAGGRLEPALHAWMHAAQLAASRQAHHETLELAQRALALQPLLVDDAEHARGQMQMHLLIASARIALQGYGSEAVEAAYLAAEGAGSRMADGAHALRIRLGLEACYVMRGDLVRADTLARSVVAGTAWERDARLALQARWALANVRFHQGDWQGALAGFDECLARYQRELHRRSSVQDPAIMCLGYVSWIHFELGRADQALRCIERLLALAQELQHPFSTGVALGFAASVKRLCGDVDGAWPHAQEAVQVCERGGFQVWLAHAWMVRGQLRADRGDVAGGDDDMDRGYALWTGSGARISCATYLVTRAEILLRQGATGRAVEQINEAWGISQQIGESYYGAELLRLKALCLWQAGALVPAEAGLHEALALAQRQSKPGLALRCAFSLGALEAGTGRRDAAARRLRPLLESLPLHGRCRDARWSTRALSAWASGQHFASTAVTPWEPTWADSTVQPSTSTT